MQDWLFWLLASITTLSAILVISRKNPIYSALYLIVCLISLAVIFVLLDAPVLAGFHILIYGGAIMVLFIFVIMLLNLKPEEFGQEFTMKTKIFIYFLCTLIFLSLAIPFYLDTSFKNMPDTQIHGITVDQKDFSSVNKLGSLLFDKFVLPFELISILVIIAILGAVVLAKRRI